MEISCYPAEYLDVLFLKDKLRDADLEEIKRGSYPGSYEALRAGLKETESYVLRVNDTPVGMCGFAPMSPSGGTLWFLGTDRSVSRDTYRLWLNLAPHFVEYGLEKYGTLINRVWNGNKAHIKWLQKLGAEIFPDDTEFSTFIFRS